MCSWQARGFCLVLGGCRIWPAFDWGWVDVSILLGTRVIMKILIHNLINIIIHLHIALGFYAFQKIIFYDIINIIIKLLTLWLPGRGACQDPDILVYEFYFSSFEAGIANATSSFKWRKIHKCSIYLTKICVILWLRSLTNDDGNFRHVWKWKG